MHTIKLQIQIVELVFYIYIRTLRNYYFVINRNKKRLLIQLKTIFTI